MGVFRETLNVHVPWSKLYAEIVELAYSGPSLPPRFPCPFCHKNRLSIYTDVNAKGCWHYCHDCHNIYFNSYVYKDGLFTPLDPPGTVVLGNYWFTDAMSINDAGVMAGFMRDESGPHAFVYVNGTFTFVDFPGATDTLLYGINNAGQLVGDYTVPGGGSHGFLATPIPEGVPEPATALLVSLSALLMLTKRPAIFRLC